MWGVSAEAIAESAGSLARYFEKKKSTGRGLQTRNLVRAVRLRAVGLRGDSVAEGAFILRVLQHRYGAQLRFFVTSRTRKERLKDREVERLGQSATLDRQRRATLEAQSASCRPWLSGPLAGVFAKKLQKQDLRRECCRVVDFAPSEISDEVWSVVLPAVRLLGLRAEALPTFT